jgi:hypothetical protein
MKGVVDRLALFLTVSWQWLTSAPRYRGALLGGLSAIGAMITIGYTGRVNFGPSPRVTHTNDVVAARISAMSNGSRTDNAEKHAVGGPNRGCRAGREFVQN